MKLQLFALALLSFAVASIEAFALFQEDGADQVAAAAEAASRALSDEVSYSMSMSMSIEYTDKCGKICRSDMNCDDACPYCEKDKGKKNGKCVEKLSGYKYNADGESYKQKKDGKHHKNKRNYL
jgi:hypothetical protein